MAKKTRRGTKALVEVSPLEVLNMRPIGNWPWPRIVACVPQFPAMPHADDVFYHFWMLAQQGLPIMNISYGRTDVVRNKAAMLLLRSNYTHVLMLDQDHQHPPDIVQRLARWVIADPTRLVVGGLNYRRGAPYEPCAFLVDKKGVLHPPLDWEDGLVRCDVIGTGSLLIAREVFEIIEPPWFFNDYSKVWEDAWPGEDIGFGRKCMDAGISHWLDTTVTSPHMIDAVIDEGAFRNYLADHTIEQVTIEEFEGVSVE